MLAHLVKVLKVERCPRNRYQNAGYLRAEQGFQVFALLGHVLARLADDDAEAGFAGRRFDAVHHGGKEAAFDVRHNHADELAFALAQGRGQVVGLVVELFGQLEHRLLGGRPNAVVVAQGPRNRGHGHAQLPSQISHGNRAAGHAGFSGRDTARGHFS